jgi:hypothetical protein
MGPKQHEAELDTETEEANAQMRDFLDLQARGIDPFSGEPAAGGPAVPWVHGDRQTWVILALIADYECHFQRTGNGYFVLAAYDAATYLPDRAAHSASLAWVHAGLSLIVRRLLAGLEDPFGPSPKRGARSLYMQAKKILRDAALALAVVNQLPAERYNETLAIERVAERQKCSVTLVGNAWRKLEKRREQQH